MDTPNIYSEDTDLNIVKSWLCGSTDGQTYSVNDRFLPRIKIPVGLEWDFCGIETEWDEIIGWKHDYKVDDPELETKAIEILDNINAFIKKVNAEPQKYFNEVKDPVKEQETKLRNAEQVLIDNGIDADEAKVVLQALGYVLLDEELYPNGI